jgi:hypothetical protein
MVPQPLKLTQEQLEQVMRIAGPIPPDLRGGYLQRVADILRGTEFGDGEVYRACRDAAKIVMWDVVRDTDARPMPREREPNRLLTAPTHKGRPIDPVKEEAAERRRTVQERRQGFERVHAEAGRRLRAIKAGEPVP